MTEEEIKLLKTLPQRWQVAILDGEIVEHQRMVDFVPTDPWLRGCGTVKIWNREMLEKLKGLRATLV